MKEESKVLCMLSEVNVKEQTATYQSNSNNEVLITLKHDRDFINYLEHMVDQGLCYYIDFKNKELVSGGI